MLCQRFNATRITLALVCFLLGLAAAAQWRTQKAINQMPDLPSNSDQAIMTRNLVENNAQLRAEVAELSVQLNTLQQSDQRDTLQVLVDELNRLKITNGLVQVSGPGIRITLAGHITMYEAQDLVNELRNAGAEAISLNDQRLIVSTPIQTNRDRLLVQGTLLEPPYVLAAIGDPETMAQACERRGGVLDLIKSSHPQLDLDVENRQKLVLPVYRQAIVFKYAMVAP